jgi:hypothetical protein
MRASLCLVTVVLILNFISCFSSTNPIEICQRFLSLSLHNNLKTTPQMENTGQIRKMKTRYDTVAHYTLPIGDQEVYMNDLVGKNISLVWDNEILCLRCGASTPKSYQQGFCFPCFRDAPETSECIIKPELCEGHLGRGKDVQWEQDHHVQPHIVYLALSSAVKVGVTRGQQVPTRWIDQGATAAIKLAEVPYRQLAGEIEVALKQHMTDKTNWRKMLTNEVKEGVDLLEEKEEVAELLDEAYWDYITDDDEVMNIEYPVEKYPEKVKSLGFDKQPEISGKLSGIKGQYLIFDDGNVLNMRKHGGYVITINDEGAVGSEATQTSLF